MIDTDQVTAGAKASQTYFEAYPTLHLTYELDDHQRLKASYSRRVQRPNIFQLNPFRFERSPTSFQQGDPELKPQITQSYEIGYEFQQKSDDYQATLYYRDNANLITNITQTLGDNVLLQTNANAGHNRNGGLELIANRQMTKALAVNLSGNLFYSEVNASNLGISQTRSAVLTSGRISLNWHVTKSDFLQINAVAGGRRLTAQGYTTSISTVNLGWRHRFDDKLAMITTLQDPFDSYRQSEVIDTPVLKQYDVARDHVRALFIGFTYAFGASSKPAKQDFDFGQPGGSTP